ncbi:MAG TPA: imidazole glycerol phosphate synthase subunit HisH [Burkholderiales bacterium]|nr:imidazole glycerol phosphate synthase subunit HisH [Burkholderiales bacterium]
MVTIIDLNTGNLQSVANAFTRVGAEISIARTADAADGAKILVLPGVGAFDRAMTRLNEQRLGPVVRRHVLEKRRPLIGICLGMQLLADRSFEHGEFAGLGLIAGEVVQLEPRPPIYRVPNIGWTTVTARKPTSMFPSGVDGESFYHVHSYHLVCRDAGDVAATFEFGGRPVVTAIERGNIFGMQFHPEKSQDAGLNLLSSLMKHIGSAG